MYHNLMNSGMGLGWTPEQIGRLTPAQLLCLFHDKPPPYQDESVDYAEQIQAAESAWRA